MNWPLYLGDAPIRLTYRAVRMTRFAATFVVGLLLVASPSSAQQPRAPTSELDTFMQQVLARRDDNWKKVQQYIFDEQERAEFRGPGEMLLWGEKREYLWYPRHGFFVRSPVRFNGVTIGERDREKYELDFLSRARKREERAQEKSAASTTDVPPPPTDVQGFIEQTRDPPFISSAYFLRFKFEGGRYALVDRETIDNRQVP